MSAEILRIVDAHKTVNSWFHPQSPWLQIPGLLLVAVAIGLAPLIARVPSDWKVEVGLALGIYPLLVLGYVVASQLKPYMTFDTRSRAAVDSWSDWFVFSFASFILFGVIGTLTLKQLLG